MATSYASAGASGARRRERLGYVAQDVERLERFGDDEGHAGAREAFGIELIAPARDEADRGRGEARAQPPGDVPARQPRHRDVAEHEIHRLLLAALEPIAAVLGDGHDVAGLAENVGEHRLHLPLVLDDEHPPPAG